MKPLPQVTEDFTELYDLISAQIRAKLMMAGLELKIFNVLTDFKPAAEVARGIGAHPENTRRFLDGLAMIDLVEKQAGLYRSRPAAGTFLVESSPAYLGSLFRLAQEMSVDSLANLTDLVTGGPPTSRPEADLWSEELWAAATRAGAGWVLGGVGQRVAGIVAKLPEFPNFKKMLDLGGGHGVFALYLVAAHPDMHGVVFDQPKVVPVAREFIREYGLEDRLIVSGGDYATDDIGRGYDLVWASATSNFVKHEMDAMLTKIYTALNPGGIFISFQDGMTHEQTRPDTMLGHLGHTLSTGMDLFLDQGFVAETALKCGFRSVRSRTLETPMGAMDMDIAHK